MSKFVQTLEPRTLFAATATELSTDLSNVIHDAAATRVALHAERSAAIADEHAVLVSLRGLSNKQQNAALVRTLNIDDASHSAKVGVAQARFLDKAVALSAIATAEGKALLLHPTNTHLQARFTAAVSALDTQLPPLLSNLQSLNSAAVLAYATDMNAIANANPSSTAVAGNVATAKTDVNSNAANYNTASSQVLSDTATLSAALKTIF